MLLNKFFQFLEQIPPPFQKSQPWNDNNRAITFAWLIAIDMFIHEIWYAFIWFIIYQSHHQSIIKFWGYEIVDQQTLDMMINNVAVIGNMVILSLAVLCFSGVAIFTFQRLCSKTMAWYLFQAGYIFVCTIYYTLFTQYFGEHTIVNGLNFTIGIVLGLLLLDKILIIATFSFCLIVFVFIGLNRKLDWLALSSFEIYAMEKVSWLWTVSYIYFTITKITMTIYSVNFILFLIKKQQQKIHKLLVLDMLTMTINRRTIYCFLDYLWQGYCRWQQLSVIYFDLDFFKQVNDDHGHDVGDYILVYMSKFINDELKSLSFNYQLGRLGGEEFVVLLPDVCLENTIKIAEQLCQKVAEETIVINNTGRYIKMTASFGVASLPCPDDVCKKSQKMMQSQCNFEDYLKDYELDLPKLPKKMQLLLYVANTAMHLAKQRGRNQVINGGVV